MVSNPKQIAKFESGTSGYEPYYSINKVLKFIHGIKWEWFWLGGPCQSWDSQKKGVQMIWKNWLKGRSYILSVCYKTIKIKVQKRKIQKLMLHIAFNTKQLM